MTDKSGKSGEEDPEVRQPDASTEATASGKPNEDTLFKDKKKKKKSGASDKDAAADSTESGTGTKNEGSEEEKAEEEALGLRLLRLQADFDNFRKRTLREKKDLYTRANEDIIEEILPVLDHMGIALAAAREHDAPQALVDGFAMVQEQMLSALKKFGLSSIDAESGSFDHNLHEAISHVQSPDVTEGGIVARIRKGYMLGDRLLRPAQVVVSSGSPEATDASDGDTV